MANYTVNTDLQRVLHYRNVHHLAKKRHCLKSISPGQITAPGNTVISGVVEAHDVITQIVTLGGR